MNIDCGEKSESTKGRCPSCGESTRSTRTCCRGKNETTKAEPARLEAAADNVLCWCKDQRRMTQRHTLTNRD